MATHSISSPHHGSFGLPRWLVVAFISGFVSVLVFHQGALALLHATGLTQISAYPMKATAPLGVPVEPSKIVCIGRNYRAHAKELGHEVPKEPLLFFKPPSALLASGGAVLLPAQSQRVEHEAAGFQTRVVTRHAVAIDSALRR